MTPEQEILIDKFDAMCKENNTNCCGMLDAIAAAFTAQIPNQEHIGVKTLLESAAHHLRVASMEYEMSFK